MDEVVPTFERKVSEYLRDVEVAEEERDKLIGQARALDRIWRGMSEGWAPEQVLEDELERMGMRVDMWEMLQCSGPLSPEDKAEQMRDKVTYDTLRKIDE